MKTILNETSKPDADSSTSAAEPDQEITPVLDFAVTNVKAIPA